MAFTVPTFNLLCNVFPLPAPFIVPRLVNVPCNLQFGRRPQSFSGGLASETLAPILMSLLVPALTDLRCAAQADEGDVIECPAGSGRFYLTLGVDDVGKGFPNEFRVAVMIAGSQYTIIAGFAGVSWPIPMP
jgi:hypothetical protein